LHNSKDNLNNGEVNLNNSGTIETIAHLIKENKGLSDSVKTLQSELKQCKIGLSKTSKEYQYNRQIQRNVSPTALPGRIDEPEHCSGNNIILGTTLATIESDKASIFNDHSCNDDCPSSDEECAIDYSCIHHYVSNDEVSTISEHSSIHEYITVDEASVDFTDDEASVDLTDSVDVRDNPSTSTPTFQEQLNPSFSKGFYKSVEIAPNKTQHKRNKFRRRQSAPRHTFNLLPESYARTKPVIYNQSHFRGRFSNPPPILAYPRIPDSSNNTFLQQHTNDIHITHLPWFRYPVQSKTSEWINHLHLVHQTMCQSILDRPKVDRMQQWRKSLYS
jgi:hypothetical protein